MCHLSEGWDLVRANPDEIPAFAGMTYYEAETVLLNFYNFYTNNSNKNYYC